MFHFPPTGELGGNAAADRSLFETAGSATTAVTQDTQPAAVAFTVAAGSLGILFFHGLYRISIKKDIALLNGCVTEFLVVVGFNALVMGLTQMGYLEYIFYAMAGIIVLMLLRDMFRAYIVTRNENDGQRGIGKLRSALASSFPTLLFSETFRDKYIDIMSSDVTTLKTETRYGDFVCSNLQNILLLFVGQLILLAMFVAGLILRGSPPFEESRAYTFYWVGIVIEACYMAGTSHMRTAYDNYAFFVNALRAARQNKTCVYSTDPKHRYALHYDDINLWARFFFSMVINNSGLMVILLTLPMQLSWADEPTEFVVDAVAALFIVELDDLTTPVIYKVINSDDKNINASIGKTEDDIIVPDDSDLTNRGTDVEDQEIVVEAVTIDGSRRPSDGLVSMYPSKVNEDKDYWNV